MNVTIELSPQKEAELKAQAQAYGLTVEQWLLQLAEQSGPVPWALMKDLPDSWEEEFEAWVNSFPDTPLLSDEAISRSGLSYVPFTAITCCV